MAHFLFRLVPPRPTFAFDMTGAERQLMQEHVAYWTELCDKRTAVAFGPVLDPQGPWGVAIVEVENETAARALADDDPVTRSGSKFKYDLFPMPQAVVRK